jgi:predicted nucleic acid-binding protein
MTNKILIDSSVLVEYAKKNKTKLLNSLLENDLMNCCINESIVSEFLFQFIKFNTNKAPASIKSAKKIKNVFESNSNYLLIHLFEFLPTDRNIFNLAPILMQQHNLLPNDAIILATCKIHNITQLASHDKDFKTACESEGITLLTED